MNEQEINIAIAESMGFIKANEVNECIETQCRWITPKGLPKMSIPKYTTDLNAMHEVEKVLTDEQWEDYGDYMEAMINPVKWWIHATALQRAEAYLRTIGKWVD